MTDLARIAPQLFFLNGESAATIDEFARLGTCRTFPRHNILFHDGDACLAAYVIVRGKVKLTLYGEDGRELALDVFGPGDICGLVGTLDGGAHAGTAVTLTSARIAILPRDNFYAWLTARPLVLQRIVMELSHMLRHAYQRVGMQALLTVKERVRSALLEVAQQDGTPSGSGDLVLERPTHRELAERVGSTRVVVSRALKELLEEEPAIRFEGRTLRVRLRDVQSAEDALVSRSTMR